MVGDDDDNYYHGTQILNMLTLYACVCMCSVYTISIWYPSSIRALSTRLFQQQQLGEGEATKAIPTLCSIFARHVDGDGDDGGGA